MFKKLKALSSWALPYLIPFLAGALMVLSFSPFGYTIISFLSMAALLYSLSHQSNKQALVRGGLFGLGLFGFGASWIYVSVYTYGGGSVVISGVITLLFVLILSVFPALLAYTLNRFFKQDTITRNVLAFPVLWVAFELLRGWIFTGFPWLFLGYSQLNTHLMWYAPIGSVWFVSWAVAINAAILYEVFKLVQSPEKKKTKMFKLVITALIIWIGATPLRHYPWTVPDKEYTVALIQGNIPQDMRWESQAIDQIAGTYLNLTTEHVDADLIIWPESAIPAPLPYSKPYFDQIHQLGVTTNTAIVTGVPAKAQNKDVYYNAMISLGLGSGYYAKQQLVPFGEYVPFEKLLRGLIAFFDLPMSNFVEGPKTKQADLTAHGLQISPAICYEIAYPTLMRTLTQKADVIITVSNDAWFGRSIGPSQHLEIAQFRALETGRYVLRATNTGVTAIINQEGKITEYIPSFERRVLRGTFENMKGNTPWIQYGPWSLYGFLIILMVVAWVQQSRANKRK